MVDTFSPKMKQCIEEELLAENYDVIIASEIDMAVYGRFVGSVPALIAELQLGVLYQEFAQSASVWRRFRYGLTWAKHRAYLARLLRHFRACTVVSEQERQLLVRIAVSLGLAGDEFQAIYQAGIKRADKIRKSRSDPASP